MSIELRYRPDIDGLRAVAVLSVILFHLKNSLVPGGFTGVDIFFVISGYLITSIIYIDLKSGRFSLKEFYIRRLRRIQPVLWVVVGVTFAFGFIILLPSDLVFLANSIRSILRLTSNFFFAQEVDYFNPAAEEYPLLHTWSLAIEEQYYLIWPFFLLILLKSRLSFKVVVGVVSMITLASFFGSEYYLHSHFDPKYIYYMLPGRMGELAIGGLLGIIHREYPRTENFSSDWLSVLGAALIGTGFFVFNSHTLFPGLAAAVPCLGAVAVIASGTDSLVNRLLKQNSIVFIGALSYSLYLWHYPVFAYFTYLRWLTPLGAVAAVAIVFALSLWSKFKVEDRYRRSQVSFGRALWSFWAKPAMILLAFVIWANDSNGIPQRYFLSKGAIARDVAPFYDNYCHQKIVGDCSIGQGKKPPGILLIGDSHAGHFIPFWDRVGTEANFTLTARSSTWCPAAIGLRSDVTYCQEQRTWFDKHYREYKVIIFAARWEFFFSRDPEVTRNWQNFLPAFRETLRVLRDQQIRVIVMPQIPRFHEREYDFAMREKYFLLGLFSQAKDREIHLAFDPVTDDTNQRLQDFLKDFPEVKTFDPVALVPEFRSRLPYRENGMAYKNSDHLNEDGAIELANQFISRRLPLPF